ncbi:hypothetical protein [Streptomyces sp. ST2-7A]|uniref:hypothetical protein n=1 Tax=Streptomyces sp. ST2-7A TaxID=2907214 RepID=UPI0027E386AE|nr:hypothetical protein [Streptomyces sp. ST2-7A]
MTPAQVAVARVRERAARSVATLVPIIGPRNLSQLDSYLGALEVQLTDAQYPRLAEVSAVPLGVPHEGIAASLDRLRGGAADRVTAPSCRSPDGGTRCGHSAPAPQPGENNTNHLVPREAGGGTDTPPSHGRETERRRR